MLVTTALVVIGILIFLFGVFGLFRGPYYGEFFYGWIAHAYFLIIAMLGLALVKKALG